MPTWAKALIGVGAVVVVGFLALVGVTYLGAQAKPEAYQVGDRVEGGGIAASDTDEDGFTKIEVDEDIGDEPASSARLCMAADAVADFQTRVSEAPTWEAARDIVMAEYQGYGRSLDDLVAASSHDAYGDFQRYRDTLRAGLDAIRDSSTAGSWNLVDVTKIYPEGTPSEADVVAAEIGRACD